MEFNVLEYIQQYAVIPVAVVCFMAGWLLKNVFDAFNSKYIPIVLLPIGIVGVLWMNGWNFTPQNVFAGICSAALAVYAHSAGKHVIEALKPPEV